MKNQPKKSKIEKSEIEIFQKMFHEKLDFSIFPQNVFFEFFIENPMKNMIFRLDFPVWDMTNFKLTSSKKFWEVEQLLQNLTQVTDKFDVRSIPSRFPACMVWNLNTLDLALVGPTYNRFQRFLNVLECIGKLGDSVRTESVRTPLHQHSCPARCLTNRRVAILTSFPNHQITSFPKHLFF